MTCNCKGKCLGKRINGRAVSMKYTHSGRTEVLELVEAMGRLAEATNNCNREDIGRAVGLIYMSIQSIAYKNKLSLQECAVSALED